MSEKNLMEHWHYTESDLNANRNNQLTERQKNLLAEKLKETKGRSGCLGLFLVGFIGFMIVATLMNPLMKSIGSWQSTGSINADSIALLAVLAVLVLIVLGIIGGLIAQMRQKPDHTIRRAEGVVNFVYVERRVKTNTGSGSRTVRSLEMRVGPDLKFVDMEDILPNLINQGEQWIFYYTNYPFIFLSAEKIK